MMIIDPTFCQEQHLICSHCRPKVKECPECRVVYQGPPRRHRSVARVNMMAKLISKYFQICREDF